MKDEPIPTPPGWLERTVSDLRTTLESNDSFKALAEDFDHIVQIRKNAALVLIILGCLFGLFIGCIFGSFGKKSSIKKSKSD